MVQDDISEASLKRAPNKPGAAPERGLNCSQGEHTHCVFNCTNRRVQGKLLCVATSQPLLTRFQPELSAKIQELRAEVPDLPPKTTRQHTLQSLSNLTGYLSSQLHLTSALDSAIRSYQFQFSMPGSTSSAPKDDIQEQMKKEIRALKGLLINRYVHLVCSMNSSNLHAVRRTFLQGSSISPTSTQRSTGAQRMYSVD